MTLEALLAAAHLLAILTIAVFITSEAALCRSDWLNAKVVERLVSVNRIYLVGLLAVLLTGLARTWWGMKGAGWYWTNGLLHLKLAIFVAVVLLAIKPAALYRQWRRELHSNGTLPDEAQLRSARGRVMLAAHLIAVVPVLAAFLARGFGSFD
jgi:putative membrane protein